MSAGMLRWKTGQTLLLAYAVLVVYALLFHPKLGLDLFWNLLIPAAPLLLFFAIGAWRNVCPLATLSLLPSRHGMSKGLRPGPVRSEWLRFAAAAVLLTVIPLRHAVFDLNAAATLCLLAGVAVIAVAAGWHFGWKSGWCSGLCPVYPVEKLYALGSDTPPSNAHCRSCTRCISPCPDRTPGFAETPLRRSGVSGITSFAMTAFFPGFVYGWFLVPDMQNAVDPASLSTVYAPEIIFGTVSALFYLLLRQKVPRNVLNRLSAAATLSIYYGFRLPALFGFGLYPDDGLLIDLSPYFPPLLFHLFAGGLSLLFFYRAYLSINKKHAWLREPTPAAKSS